MNSYVSVEEEDVQCDDLDSLVLSASGIFEASLSTKGSDCNFVISGEDLHTPHISSTTDELLCVTGDNLPINNIETRSKTKLSKPFKGSKKNHSQNLKVHPEIEIDGKLISLDVGESYENINSLGIECLPFETVLMNYPGQVDYFDLNDKLLNISGSPNLFDSDQESESFDGFSEDSNSSFEGFNDSDPCSQINTFKEGKDKVGLPRSQSPKTTYFSKEQGSSLKCDFNFKSKNISESVHKGIISPVFGDQRVTPLTSKEENSLQSSKLDFNFVSTLRPGHSQPRPSSVQDIELPESSQNYFKSVTSPVRYSATSKFKEKTNESGTMQEKSKKERLISHSYKSSTHKKNEFTAETERKCTPCYEDFFSDDSDIELTFEGFQENLTNNSVDIKNEPEDSNDIEEFIGINCDKIGCTISWLESKQVKNPPQLVNNGIIFELSEFAKKIAWEPDYVAEWVCRLKGYLDIKISDEDMRKINVVLKRRKAITVNFAGKNLLKSKLATFDTELFTLPSIENFETKINGISVVENSNNEYIVQKFNTKNVPNKNIQVPDNAVFSDPENKQELKPSQYNLQKEALNLNLDKDESIEMADHSDVGDLFDISDLEISDKDSSDAEDINSKLNEDLSENSNIRFSMENRISGRVRKPTTKAQESYSIKYFGSATPPQSVSPMRSKILHPMFVDDGKDMVHCKAAHSPMKPKILHPVFVDDGEDIGSHCKAAHIDIKLLNSNKESSLPITKGVVYELYNFFRERKASLTSLVHTLYRLKNLSFDKSHIIATMAKIHEMVKVMWKENIDKDKNMPFEEINLLDFECSEKITNGQSLSKTNIAKDNTEIIQEPLCKKRKRSSSFESLSGKESDSNSESSTISVKENLNSNSELSTESMKENLNKSFDLNSTKGFEGKITRGDIVYLYTKWLKKKMEGQSNVFVTDLSKDVEELIIERKVECIRIPVGTLMSSSVKLFEEFRKLSKVNMLDAKTYLLEDWIDDIKCILSSNEKKLEAAQDSNATKTSNANIDSKNKFNNSLPKEGICLLKEDSLRDSQHKNKKIASSVLDDHEVEKIVGYRIVKMGDESVTEYRIRWLDSSSKDDSWINETDLNCPEILARFWDALNKQRALKNKTDSLVMENCNIKQPISDSNITKNKTDSLSIENRNIKQPVSDSNIKNEKIYLNQSTVKKVDEPKNQPIEYDMASMTDTFPNSTISEENQSLKSLKDQENISPFFGKGSKASQNFFNIMINNLKPDLVDYQHEEEGSFSKRIKITKGEILRLYDDWRVKNQELELTDGNKRVDVNVLVSKVKDFVASKKVRNFNPISLIDACYRMSLMRSKLKASNKVQEYLSGDFIELMQMSQKHQDFVRSENAEKLKKIKQGKSNGLNENDKLNTKINNINNLERESLIIAKYLDSNKNKNIEKDLESNILFLKKKLIKEQIEENFIVNIKKENSSVIKDLEAYGVVDNTLDEILNIANKIKI